MESSAGHRKTQSRRRTAATTPKSSWCCSFKSPPKSPETLSLSSSKTAVSNLPTKKKHLPYNPHHPPSETPLSLPKSLNSFPSSPQSSKSGLGIVARRILSPGRVSPIDSDPTESIPANVGRDEDVGSVQDTNLCGDVGEGVGEDEGQGQDDEERENEVSDDGDEVDGVYDVRLSLKGKNGGGCLVLELNSKVLGENSPIFAGLIANCRKGLRGADGGGGRFCRIEVPEVENLAVFRETIELMFEDDVTKRLIKVGAYRAIAILEVSASINFTRGVFSCLKYLEAVPWTEEEEEKLRRLFTKFKFEETTSNEIFSRLNLHDSNIPQQNLASQLVRSITTCGNVKARTELKTMMKGLLSKSSVYEKDLVDITKEDLYSVSQSCLSSLITIFQEASGTLPPDQQACKHTEKSMVELVSWQVENLNWLLEILLHRHMAEDFVDIWTQQKELLKLHSSASPMVRYELSRVSAVLFAAMGMRKLQCRAELRFGLLNSWFGPMLMDFGWLQRCKKGLDVRELEEAMGQALLTLPLKQQYSLFMEWFRCFSKHGTECPNLSKAFQIWWRRSFLRGSESHAIESR